MTAVLKFTPDAMSSADIKSMHVGRSNILNSVLKRIQSLIDSGGTMNVIFVGQHGVGKTHILRMIMDGLADKIVPAVFAQEEYSICTIDGFFARVLETINEDYSGSDVAYHARCVLKRRRAEGKPVVVFVENLHMLFSQMESDLGKLRAAMQEDDSFFIVGSALTVFGQVTSMSAPFYNFFEIRRLDGLDSEEIGELIKKRFRSRKTSAKVSLSKHKLDGLRVLTGGNPRLVHMLCDEMLDKNSIGDLEDNLITLLDEMTPVYQNRIEAMPTEVRKIFDVMALADGPLTPTEIALKIGTKNSITAAQISRMKNHGLVEPVKFGRKKETRYQITEWLYRMWREFRRNRGSAKLKILVDFLKLWYSEDRLRQEYERMSDEFESGKQKSDAINILMRMSKVLAAMEGHGIVMLSETVEKFCLLGEIDKCKIEIENHKKYAKAETNETLRLSREIITTNLELRVCDSDKRQTVVNAVLTKIQRLENAMQTHPHIPHTYEAHLLLGGVADIGGKYNEWEMVEKVSSVALDCIPKTYCHGCTMWNVSANTYMRKYKKSMDLIQSTLRRFGKKIDSEQRSDLLSYKIHIHSKMRDHAGVSTCSTYILRHNMKIIGSVVSAYFELDEFDKAYKIVQKHIQRLNQSKSGDLETVVENVLVESVMCVLHRQPDGHSNKAIAECLKVLEPFVVPSMFREIAEILVNHGYNADELHTVTETLSKAFADSQMGSIRILKCATEYIVTEDPSLFEKIHQEQRILAFSIIREISPSTKIPQHVLDSAP